MEQVICGQCRIQAYRRERWLRLGESRLRGERDSRPLRLSSLRGFDGEEDRSRPCFLRSCSWMRWNSSRERGAFCSPMPGSGSCGSGGGRLRSQAPPPASGGIRSLPASKGRPSSLEPARVGSPTLATTTAPSVAFEASVTSGLPASDGFVAGMPPISFKNASSFGCRLAVVPSGRSKPPSEDFASRAVGTPTAGRILFASGSWLPGHSEMW